MENEKMMGAFFSLKNAVQQYKGQWWVTADGYTTHKDTLIELYYAVKKNRAEWLIAITEKYFAELYEKKQ